MRRVCRWLDCSKWWGHLPRIWGEYRKLAAAARAEILINCTTVGMQGADRSAGSGQALPLPIELLPRTGVVCDLIYNPPETPLLRAARERSLWFINGLGMLVAQGALAFTLWTGLPAPEDVMTRAGWAALTSRSHHPAG